MAVRNFMKQRSGMGEAQNLTHTWALSSLVAALLNPVHFTGFDYFWVVFFTIIFEIFKKRLVKDYKNDKQNQKQSKRVNQLMINDWRIFVEFTQVVLFHWGLVSFNI